MDLIQELASKVGIGQDQAQALAGAVLGGVKSQVSGKLSPEEGQQLDKAIPELGGWMDMGKSLLASAQGGGGGGGGLLGAAAGMLGGGGNSGGFDVGTITSLLGKMNLDGGKVGGVVEVVTAFLKNRLGGGLFEKISGLVPMLGAGGGGVAGALGGLLGKR